MKKLPDDFSVYAKTLEEAKYITEKQKELCGDFITTQPLTYYRFRLKGHHDKYGHSGQSYITNLSLKETYNITHEFTFKEFKSYFEEEQYIPDFKIKGTKLPLINEDIQFKATFWNNFRQNSTEYSCREYQQYSFGHEVINGVTYILSDKLEYKATNYWMFKEEDLIRLYKKQNNIKDMELISIKKLKLDQEYVVYLETKEEWEILNKLVDGKGLCIFCKGECHSLYNCTHSSSSDRNNPGSYAHNDKPSKIITIYQIKEYQDMKNKQIIGYKLVKPEYMVFANKLIMGTGTHIYKTDITIDIKYHPGAFEIWKQAGVLDLWFEPVYKSKEEIISINGQFNLRVEDKRVFYNSEDITDYVKSMGEWYENIPKKFGKYDFNIRNIELSKTGCEYKTTTIENWLKIYNLIK